MKRKNQIRIFCGITLTAMIPAAMLILSPAAYGKTTSSPSVTWEYSSMQQATSPAKQDSIYEEVDEMPLFPDGDSGLLKYISTNTRYPEEAKKNNVTGKVLIKFIVGKDCTVSGVKVLTGVNPAIDAEAVRVISSLPKFEKPARKAGKTVSVYYVVPITFSLK